MRTAGSGRRSLQSPTLTSLKSGWPEAMGSEQAVGNSKVQAFTRVSLYTVLCLWMGLRAVVEGVVVMVGAGTQSGRKGGYLEETEC